MKRFLLLAFSAILALSVEAQRVPSAKQQFSQALAKLNSTSPATVKDGAAVMEQLSSMNYPPAIYELAYTYGWFSDSASLARKRMLGINIFTEGSSKFMPKEDRWSNKALALFTRLLELKDNTYADFNAEAAYRLACYYEIPNEIFMPNREKTLHYLRIAKEWATLAGNKEKLQRIDTTLDIINKNNK